MHFWIDKRSQCGYSGRRAPPSLSTGVGRTRRERHLKPMVTPVHRFQSVECVAGPARPHHPLQHTQRITHHFGIPVSNGVVPPGVAARPPVETDTSVYLEPPNEPPGPRLRSPPPPLMPPHLKCGMWASFALATIFVASAKFYFDHQILYDQGSGMEVLVFCGLLVVLLLGACTVSLCRARVPPSLPLPPLTAPPLLNVVRQDSNSDLSLGTMLSLQAAVPVPQGPPPAPVPPPPPPPYHIAVLLPARPVTEAPPPSYEKAIS